jgi:cyanophycinase-like exopeptidase
MSQPGPIVLFGSGETSASGRKVYDWLFGRLPSPIRAIVLETPAGFQPNSMLVAEEVARFLRERLQNYRPKVVVVPARKRGTPFSPDDPQIVAPLSTADVMFLGPGSPTYAARQLQDSLAWRTLVARHWLGAAIILSSAATIAAGAQVLPVYEIYKVGEELHWAPGLNLLAPFGLSLVLIPHWDNAEGGEALDTSRCFMGRERFERLLRLLPDDVTVIGIDEHTALIVDVAAGRCQVMGRGGVTRLRDGQETHFVGGEFFAASELGDFRTPDLPIGPGEGRAGVPEYVWQSIRSAVAAEDAALPASPPAQVLSLVAERESARARRDWETADELRDRLLALGWQIEDSPEGPRIVAAQKRTPFQVSYRGGEGG